MPPRSVCHATSLFDCAPRLEHVIDAHIVGEVHIETSERVAMCPDERHPVDCRIESGERPLKGGMRIPDLQQCQQRLNDRLRQSSSQFIRRVVVAIDVAPHTGAAESSMLRPASRPT